MHAHSTVLLAGLLSLADATAGSYLPGPPYPYIGSSQTSIGTGWTTHTKLHTSTNSILSSPTSHSTHALSSGLSSVQSDGTGPPYYLPSYGSSAPPHSYPHGSGVHTSLRPHISQSPHSSVPAHSTGVPHYLPSHASNVPPHSPPRGTNVYTFPFPHGTGVYTSSIPHRSGAPHASHPHGYGTHTPSSGLSSPLGHRTKTYHPSHTYTRTTVEIRPITTTYTSFGSTQTSVYTTVITITRTLPYNGWGNQPSSSVKSSPCHEGSVTAPTSHPGTISLTNSQTPSPTPLKPSPVLPNSGDCPVASTVYLSIPNEIFTSVETQTTTLTAVSTSTLYLSGEHSISTVTVTEPMPSSVTVYITAKEPASTVTCTETKILSYTYYPTGKYVSGSSGLLPPTGSSVSPTGNYAEPTAWRWW